MFFDKLSIIQKCLLLYLASFKSDNLFSEEIRIEYSLGGTSSSAGAIKALTENDVLEKKTKSKYIFVNPAFKLWLNFMKEEGLNGLG